MSDRTKEIILKALLVIILTMVGFMEKGGKNYEY